jgi:glycosyltransferase involved in cell wall biosynthesis
MGEQSGGGAKKHVAIFLDHLGGGGIQKTQLIMADALARRGHRVDLAVCVAQGPLRSQISERLRLLELEPDSRFSARCRIFPVAPRSLRALVGLTLRMVQPSPTLPYLSSLATYLDRERPDALYAATPDMNIEASLAARMAGASVRLILSEHNTLVRGHPITRGWQRRFLPSVLRECYAKAAAIVAVSKGVADDITHRTGFPREQITVIYNPVVGPDLLRRAQEPVDHPWFQPGNPPVMLGAGRLGKAKDFPTLIRAFAIVRRRMPARLVILGEGKKPKKTAKRQAELTALATRLNVADDVALLGFQSNPLAYMARSALFVLSSLYEGLGNVLIEALACGCPVVSTNCPSGPAEILENGKFGPLVPVNDPAALAAAIISVLQDPPNPERLRERAGLFSIDRAVDRYESLLL